MRISDEAAREIGRLITRAIESRKMTASAVANAATALLPPGASLDVSPQYVAQLRGAPRQPLAREESRLKFAAVVDALGLDRGKMNRLAGGI